jgi:hypothetical protein
MSVSASESMEETLRHLESYAFPGHLLDESGHTDRSLTMEEYKKTRDFYLQRKLLHETIQRATSSFDSSTQSFVGTSNLEISVEEKQALEERRQQVLDMLSNKALLLQQKELELNSKYAHFLQRREEFISLKQLQQDDDSDDGDDLFDVTMEYEHELLVQEGKIKKLNERRAELQAQLQNIQHRNSMVMQDVDHYKSQVDALVSSSTNNGNQENDSLRGLISDMKVGDIRNMPGDRLRELNIQNNDMNEKLQKFVEIKHFYTNLRQLLENLSGIRFLNIASNAPVSNSATKDESGVTMTVQLLEKFDVEIALEYTVGSSSNNTKNNCIIHSATIVSDNAVIFGPRLSMSESSRMTDSDPSIVQLRIPNFDDIVTFANTYAPGESLRVLLREVLARISMIEARVHELTVLQSENGIVATIGPLCIYSTKTTGSEKGIGTMMHDQEVVCSLNHPPMTTVLRLTGNCPLMDGSIYIDQLIGLGGWDTQMVERIHDTISEMKYRTPMQIIAALQKEVQRLQDEEQFVVPSTPRIPARFQFE